MDDPSAQTFQLLNVPTMEPVDAANNGGMSLSGGFRMVVLEHSANRAVAAEQFPPKELSDHSE